MNHKIIYLSIAVLLGFIQCRNEEPDFDQLKRSNIIFLLADDLRDNMFSIDGQPVLQTPNIDALMRDGIRFRNTYIAEPVCAPSRVSLLTGVSERIHGIGFSSSYELTDEQWEQSYPAILKRSGYYTGFIGKIGIEYYTFKERIDKKFDYWYGHNGWTRFFPKDYDTPSCRPYHTAKNDIITPIMSEGISGFLNSVPDDKSFCLSVSFNVPHGSQTTTMYEDYEGWHSMKLPSNLNPKLQGHAIYDTLYRTSEIRIPEATATDPYVHIPKSILNQDKGRNRTYDYSYNDETCKEHHIRYFQVIKGLDKAIGELMLELKKNDLEDNTIIIFASDHGLLMGEYGMGGKALLYDLTAKIPCFIYDPDLPDSLKGREMHQLVSSLDIPSTILDYADVNIPAYFQGQSLKPLIKGEDSAWRDELFLESLFTMRDNPFCEGIRMENWKYIRMYDGVHPYKESHLEFSGREPGYEQLFNLEADPGEEINLIEVYKNTKFLDSIRGKVQHYSDEMNTDRQNYKTKHPTSER
jgi:arylsulfatase A-like enzyme